MNLKIKKIYEEDEDIKALTQISGFCILSLLCKRIFKDQFILTDDEIIDFDFKNNYYKKSDVNINRKYIESVNNYYEKSRKSGLLW